MHFFFTLVVFGSQVAPGLILKAVFDAISDPASAAYADPGQQWGLVGLYAILQLVMLAASLGAEWYGWTFRFVVGGLLRRNLLASILRLPDQAGKILAACIAVVIMALTRLAWGRIIHYNRLTASSTDARDRFPGREFWGGAGDQDCQCRRRRNRSFSAP